MEVSQEKVDELQALILKWEKKRWEVKQGNYQKFEELTKQIQGVFWTCEFLEIDIGIRRAGRYYKLAKEDK